MSQSQCGRSVSQPGYPSRHGGPLPRRLPDGPRPHPPPARAFPGAPCGGPGVSGISPGFPGLSRGGGQVGHVLLTRSPLYLRPRALTRSTCMC